MINDKELAAIIARKIFESGDWNGKCHRIQFMIGTSPERPGSGFAEEPLANLIETVLKENRSY